MDWTHFKVDGSSGGTIACSRIDAAGKAPVAVLGHGIGSQRFNSTNTALAPRLVDAGVSVVVYDASGHGESTGVFGEVSQLDVARDIADVVAATSHGERRNVGLLGNSYSGGASVLFAQGGGVACLGLKAPCLDWESALRSKVGSDAVDAWEASRVATGASGDEMHFSTVEAVRTVDIFDAFARLEMPVRVWQGTADEDIPRADWQRLADLCGRGDKNFVAFEGGNHRLSDADFEPFLDDVVAYFCEHLF